MSNAGYLGSRWARHAAAVGIAALVVGGGLAACSGPGSPVPVAEGFGPGDGLNRFVVTLVDAAALPIAALPIEEPRTPTTAPTSAPMPEGSATAAPDLGAATGTRGRLDVALLARAHAVLGLDGRLVAFGTQPYYVADGRAMLVAPGGDGSVVDAPSLTLDTPATPEDGTADAVGPTTSDAAMPDAATPDPTIPDPTTSDAAMPDPATSGAATSPQDVLAALAARPGVHSAQRLTDGTVLVATGLTQDQLGAFPEVADVAPSTAVPVLGTVEELTVAELTVEELTVAEPSAAGLPAAGVLAAAQPDDPFLAYYGWNLRNTGTNAYQQTAVAGADIDALTAWTVTQGQGVVVAVVDTGFDSDHPDLVGSLWSNPTEACGAGDTNGNGKAGDCHGWNFYANSADIDNGALGTHGTSVSGVIGARAGNGVGSAGVAPQVQLMPLVVGGGQSVDVNLAAEAIRYAADNGADVVNASFGGSFGGYALENLRAAVDYAIGKGVVVVAAAGNDSANRDASAVYPASLDNPALLTVASSTASDTLAAHSAYGVSSVDLAAPGEGVVTTWNDGGYRIVSGTSTAAPHVAAAAALHLSLQDRTPAQVRAALLADVDPLPALAGRTVSGGRLDVGPLASTATRLAFTFSGMVAEPGQQRPVVEVASTAPAGTYAVTFGLAMLVDGEVWAVADEDVTFAGALATTDDAGTVTFSLGALPGLGTRTLEPVLSLGAGDFALTVQVLRDGEPLTRPYAAPLVVTAGTQPGDGGTSDPGTGGTDPGTGGTDPGTGGGEPGSGGTDPGTGGGTEPGAGGGTEPGTGGGTTPPDGGGKVPGIGTGGSSDPDGGSSDPDGGSTGPDGGSTQPGGSITPGGGTGTDPGTGGGGTSPGTGGSTNPGTGGGTDPGTGGATEPPVGTNPTPSGPDVGWYDRVGAFAITQLSPVHVPATGGTLVTVRGEALEPGVSVRVGTTATAAVVVSTTQELVFRTPPRVPGTYDVTISRSGRTSVLVDALVYLAPGESAPTQPGAGGPSTGGSGDGSDDGSGGGTGGGTDPGAGTEPGGGSGGGTAPGTDPGAGGGTSPGSGDSGGGDSGGGEAGGGTPQAPRTSRTGPNGERLVRNDALAPLAGLWSRQCTTACVGVQV